MKEAVIIVRYEYDSDFLLDKIQKISLKYPVYIYDNSKVPMVCNVDNVFYLHDGNNSGLPSAINKCVLQALSDDVNVCVYFDQDSELDLGVINGLFSSYREQKSKNAKVFALGPQPMRSDMEYPVNKRYELSSGVFIAREIITSGMTFSPKDVAKIGYFNASMFMDVFDFEMCWRATKSGMLVLIDSRVKMHHVVGDNTIVLPFKIIPISSPLRNYYQIRNMLFLLIYSDQRSLFRVGCYLLRRLCNIVLNMLFADQRVLRLKYNMLGIRDAFKKKMGKLTS